MRVRVVLFGVGLCWLCACDPRHAAHSAPVQGDPNADGPTVTGHMPDNDAATPSADTGPMADRRTQRDAGPPALPPGAAGSAPPLIDAGSITDATLGAVDAAASVDGANNATSAPATLKASSPPDAASHVPCTAWLRLEFAGITSTDTTKALALDCDSQPRPVDAAWISPSVLAVNPAGQLPAGAHCTLRWSSSEPAARLLFDTATSCTSSVIPYDRNAGDSLPPFPDDYFLVSDPATTTGKRVQIDVPKVDPALAVLLTSLIAPSRGLDGMSPLGPIVVELPAALDPSSLPRSAAESVDPFASIGLFDVDEASATYTQRIPFDALLRDNTDSNGSESHVLVVFPSVPLRPRGHYAFVITNRVQTRSGQALGASPFMQAASGDKPSSAAEQRGAASLVRPLQAFRKLRPKLDASDIALALGISVRSVDQIPNDLLAIRQQLLAADPPVFSVTSSSADSEANSDVAAIVSGTWQPLSFRNGDFVARDRSGRPTATGTVRLPFTLALPKAAQTKAVPIVLYQHGQPGNAETEVPRAARRGLAHAGFAVLGFSDVVNREIIPNGDIAALNLQAFLTLITRQDLPDYLSLETHAEQLAMLRMLPTLHDLDVLPLGAPDGRPDLDPTAPVRYLGISQGSTHGLGILAFAPEIRAAALTVGAGRFSATLVHQAPEQLYQGVASAFSGLTHAQFYAAIALVQMAFDRQDSLNLARFMFRQRLDLGVASRANVLLTEGLGDTLVPYYATRSAAAQLGLSQLMPSAARVPFLDAAMAPLSANIDAAISGAFFQFVPKDYGGAPATPSCAQAETEGHYCAQTADEAVRQRVSFFESVGRGQAAIIEVFP
jgi:hypothetical protein